VSERVYSQASVRQSSPLESALTLEVWGRVWPMQRHKIDWLVEVGGWREQQAGTVACHLQTRSTLHQRVCFHIRLQFSCRLS
jgi:hypothetical protein